MCKYLKIILILSVLSWPSMERPKAATKPYLTNKLSLKIVSIYKLNPKVWGTYRLSKEYVYKIDKTNQKKSLVLKTSSRYLKESLLFEKNKLFIIRSHSNENSKAKLLVKSFPYMGGRKGIKVELFKNKDDFYNLSYSKLSNIIENLDDHKGLKLQGPNYLYIGDMNCKKKQKSFHCTTNVTLSLI